MDDYSSSAIAQKASFGFTGFINGDLAAMKPSNGKPPAAEERIQRVIISSDADNIMVAHCAKRVDKMLKETNKCTQDNTLSPDTARRMAASATFSASSARSAGHR